MFKRYVQGFLFLCTSTLVTACSESNHGGGNGTVTATVNGAAFSSSGGNVVAMLTPNVAHRKAVPCGTLPAVGGLLQSPALLEVGNCALTPTRKCASPGSACIITGGQSGQCTDSATDVANPCVCLVMAHRTELTISAGSDAGKQLLTIAVADYNPSSGVATYSFDTSSQALGGWDPGTGNDSIVSGNIVITSNGPPIVGVFMGVTQNGVNITNGAFSVSP